MTRAPPWDILALPTLGIADLMDFFFQYLGWFKIFGAPTSLAPHTLHTELARPCSFTPNCLIYLFKVMIIKLKYKNTFFSVSSDFTAQLFGWLAWLARLTEFITLPTHSDVAEC